MPNNIDTSALNRFLNMLTLETVLSSLAILLLCVIISKVVLRIIRRIFSHMHVDARLEKFILTGLRVIMYVVTVIIVAQNLGIPSSSLIALLSVGALAISLAVQGTLSNVAGGMMLLTSRPISTGDYVEVAGVSGSVREVGMLYTTLDGVDGETIMLPNSSISSERITNFSALGRRRIALSIGVSYDAPSEEVYAALSEAVANTEGLLDDPEPEIRLNAFLDSSIQYHVYVWCPSDVSRVTRQILNEEIKKAFDARGIEIPYNHLNVHITNDSRINVQNHE